MADKASVSTVMHAVVAVPPIHDFYHTPHRFSSLGAVTVAKILAKRGISSDVLNFPQYKQSSTIEPLPSFFRHLEPFIIKNETGPTSFFTRFRHFGPNMTKCADIIIKSRPDICFLSCFAFPYASQTIELALSIKKALPTLLVVAGGAGISAYPEYFLRCPAIDYVIVGESEVSLISFVEAFCSANPYFSNIPNLYWKDDKNIYPPRYQRTALQEELDFVWTPISVTPRLIYISTSLSRGCPKGCRFCTNFLCHGSDYRTVPLEKVKDGIESIKKFIEKNHSKKVIVNFEDDNLLLNIEYLLQVLVMFKKIHPDISFHAENGIDYTNLTPELADRLIDIGLCRFNLSIASTDQSILKQENRFLNLKLLQQITQLCANRNVRCCIYFVCGFKEETKQITTDNLRYLAKLPTTLGISLFYAIPGMKGFENRYQFDSIPPELCLGTAAYPWNKSLTTEELVTAFRLSRFINLFKNPNKTAFERFLVQQIIGQKRLFTIVKKNKDKCIVEVEHYDREMVIMFLKEASSLINNV